MVILNEKYYRTLMTEGGDGIRNTFYSHVVLDAFGELTIVEFEFACIICPTGPHVHSQSELNLCSVLECLKWC